MNVMDIKGIIPPIITPIKNDEDIDEKAFRDLLRHCHEKGLHALFIAGSNGETMSLTQKQRDRAIRIALSEIGGEMPVLCGVMDTSTRRVIDNIKELEQAGGQVAVATPAFYIRNACQQEIIRHFEKIAASTEIAIMVYNIPQFTQVNIKPETALELARIDRIIGLKESSGSFTQFQKCMDYFRDTNFKVYQGITEMGGISMLLGADGMIPVLAPLFPAIFLQLYDAAINRRIEEMIFVQRIVCLIGEIMGMSANATSAAKYAISRIGLSSKKVTMPCEPLKDIEEKNISKMIDQINEEFENPIREMGKKAISADFLAEKTNLLNTRYIGNHTKPTLIMQKAYDII